MRELLTRRCPACGFRLAEDEVVRIPVSPSAALSSAALSVGPPAGAPRPAAAVVAYCPFDRTPLPPVDLAASELGSYSLVRRLGDGGMGAVYEAVHRKLGRHVALKVLQRQLAPDRGIVNRFLHEARAANTIRHPNVIEIYDFVDSGPDIYFVMELLRGQDLHDAIHLHEADAHPGGRRSEAEYRSQPLALDRAAGILEQIAAALHAAHSRNIVHRDLKPENVFLIARDGAPDFVKVIDFGIAKLRRPDGRSTVHGAVLGTPEYMAPEQARGIEVDARADIYSLGCIAYEMLTGRQVFSAEGVSDVISMQISGVPQPLRAHVANVPARVEDVVLRALAKDPSARFPTARAFAESLRAAMGGVLQRPSAFEWPPAAEIRSSVVFEASRTPLPPGDLPLARRSSSHGHGAHGHAVTSVWRPMFAGAVLCGVIAAAVTTAPLDTSGRGPARLRFGARASGDSPEGPGLVVSGVPVPAPPLGIAVTLQSVPSGAEVVDERGRSLGVTPLTLALPPGSTRRIEFKKAGFESAFRTFVADADVTVAVELAEAGGRTGGPRPGGRNVRFAPRKASTASLALDAQATMNPFGH